MSDSSDVEGMTTDDSMILPAIPTKGKRKVMGSFGKKGKVFASKSKMLELVDTVNAEQEHKVGLLIERDVSYQNYLALDLTFFPRLSSLRGLHSGKHPRKKRKIPRGANWKM